MLEQILEQSNQDSNEEEESENENNKSIFKKINHYLFYIICILLY